MDASKKNEMLKRAAAIEEECNHFLKTYVSDISAEIAHRRGAAIASQFQKLLTIGHEHCAHPMVVQVLVVPLDKLKEGSVPDVPGHLRGKMVMRCFVDARDGFYRMVSASEVIAGVAIGAQPLRSSFEELTSMGIAPQEIVQGMLQVIFDTTVNAMTNMPTAQA
jgi:hypothetical protein